MKTIVFKAVVAAAAAMALAACSSEPAKTTEVKTDEVKKPAGPPEPILAQDAFYKMYTPAHAWAADMEPITLKSGEITGIKNMDGKAGMWTAVFGSPSLRAARTYVYAVADDLPTVSKGIQTGETVPWNGPTTAVETFQTSDFKIDSDAAYKTAADKAAAWLKEKDNAQKPVSFSLGASSRFPAPVWYIVFGSTKEGFAVVVNASDGSIIVK